MEEDNLEHSSKLFETGSSIDPNSIDISIPDLNILPETVSLPEVIISSNSGPEMISECETESFEDLGPAHSLRINVPSKPTSQSQDMSEVASTSTMPPVLPNQVEVQSESQVQVQEPIETNISKISISTPYKPEGIQRRITEDNQRLTP